LIDDLSVDNNAVQKKMSIQNQMKKLIFNTLKAVAFIIIYDQNERVELLVLSFYFCASLISARSINVFQPTRFVYVTRSSPNIPNFSVFLTPGSPASPQQDTK